MSGKLVLVATPIGNLGDVTLRSVETLKSVDIICAEDTRHSRILLDRYGIDKKAVSYHDHNADLMTPQILNWVNEGQTVALISDAGSPGISDPGFRAVSAVIGAGLTVEVLPGPTSVTTALVLSGLAVDRFVFEGFLPVKKGRHTRLQELKSEPRTMIFFEAPHRIAKTVKDLTDYLGGDRLAAVCREMTKLHEEVIRANLSALVERFSTTPKGEIVLVIEGLTAASKRRRVEIKSL